MNKSNILATLKLIAIILITSFLIDKIIYFSLNRLGSQVFTGQTVGKLNQYIAVKDTLDIVVFGSSRANHHIDPTRFSQSSFNMGMDGQFIAYFTTLIKLLPKNITQKVILHLDPNKLFDEKYLGNDISALSIKYHENQIIKSEIDKAENASFLNHFFWSLDYNKSAFGIIKNFFKPKYDYTKYNGFDPLTLTKTQEEIRNKVLNKKNTQVCDTILIQNNYFLKYLVEIKEFCKSNQKDLVIITSPVFKDDCREDNLILAEVLDSLNITYIDYTNFLNNTNSITLWKDNIHLSKAGAELFTNQLIKDLSH